MKNIENNNNNKHQKTKRKLQVVGILLTLLGASFAITGITSFATDNFELFTFAFVGLPMFAIGLSITIFAFRKEITTYVKNESVPVINDFSKEVSPAVTSITQSVKNGLNDIIICECGTENDVDSRFCKSCGKPLIKTCKYCGKTVDNDSKFCNHCGKELD